MKKNRNVMIMDFQRHKYKYLIVLPVIIYLAIFCYKPMYGVVIAFQKFQPSLGIADSPWVGFAQFERAFSDLYFWRALKNTLTISLLSLVFSFPVPIILALILNEVRVKWFGRTVQTITYMPHFISLVVVCGLINSFCQSEGLITDLLVFFGANRENLLANPNYYYPIYIISGIWASAGWDSIIYLAALSSIDQEQYEAAKVDGAGRLQQLFYITLPGLLPTVVMLLILRMGSILGVGYEKTLLLYQPLTYEVADVLSTYVYRKGLIDANYSFSTAVGLFDSLVGLILVVTVNKISKKFGQSGLF